MRRFAWQIGGIAVALGAVLALGVFVFACGSPATVRLNTTATTTPRPSPTPDPRIAEVEAAAKRYVEALDNAMKTGSPQELDSLSVPGSQAEGNAGVAAHVVHDTGRAFVVTSLNVTGNQATLIGSAEASAAIAYTISGYDAAWPSLKPLAAVRSVSSTKQLEFSLVGGQWLVDTER